MLWGDPTCLLGAEDPPRGACQCPGVTALRGNPASRLPGWEIRGMGRALFARQQQHTPLGFYNSSRKHSAQLVSWCTMFFILSGDVWVFHIPVPSPSCTFTSSQTGWDRGSANGAVVRQSGWEQFVLLLPLITAPPKEVKTS